MSYKYTPMFFFNVHCRGNEKNLSDCFDLSEVRNSLIRDVTEDYEGTKVECGMHSNQKKNFFFALQL